MSSRSIGSKLLGLEERLRSETSAPPRRPHLNIGASIPVVQVSQASLETDAKLREIHSMSGNLTINNKCYRTNKDDLQHRGELGNGTSGHVVEMLHIPSGAVIAVKQMRRSGNFEENKRILMDLEVVLRSQCPYIVGCLGYFITAADVWICMELMASCFDKILKKLGGPIPEDILGKVTVATVNALSYLKEEHGVIHRDVKPSNILVDERGVVKLCDFGISGRLVDSKAKTRSAGCAAYMAPERIDPPDPQRPDYDIRADVWSLGITLVELATGKFPYRDCQNDFEVLSRVIEEEPPELPDSPIFSEEFKSFVHQCLIKDYRLRPKYAALLEHPFVRRAAESNASVGNWLASALPAGSLRLSASTPVFHHKIRTGNSGEQNITKDHPSPQSSQHNGLNSFSFSLDHNASSRTAVTNATSVTPVKEENVHSSSINNAEKLINTSKPCEQSDQSSSDNEMLSIVVISTANNLIVDKKEPLSCVSSLEEPSTSINNISVESNPSNLNDLNKKLSENLAISKNIPEKRSSNIYSPPVERNNMVTPDKVNLISGSRNTHVNKNHIQAQQLNVDGSPEYDLNSPHRIRSLSNTMLCGSNATSERWPPPKLISSSPNTKKYFANIDIRNQPFSGGGGPSSFENYTNQNRRQELMQSEYRSYGSPEVNRKQYFSPSRNKKSSSFEHANQGMESPRNIASPTNFIVSKIDLFENEPSPPCFKPNEPTNYFTSTSVCTMSRYSGTPAIRNRNGIIYAGSYHQNPGGSCSQPASLEAYGDTRHTPHGYSRVPEKSFSPPLWSPQPAPRRAGRERDDRDRDTWRTSDTSHHQQGNTSPIVLQRFYHQQGQRRSRRDWDSNPRQSSSSLSRETSVGRSPEPPRRANRDPSQSREHAPQIEHPLLREWRERDRTPSQHRVPSRNESTAGILDNDRQSEYRSHQMNEGDRSPLCFSPTARRDREQIVNEANAQFESKMKKSTYHHHMREKDTRDELNGDCYKMSRIESCKKDIPISSEQIRIENKSSKEKCKDKVKKNDCSTQQSHRDENIQYSPVMLPKHVRNHGKEKDDQGSSRSSSPSAAGGSMKGSRLTPLPRRIATSEYDDIAKRMQDSPHNFVPGLRNSGGPPQPPPRRTTDSWSLPASPLPTRPI